MIGGPGAKVSKPENLQAEWRVFVQSTHHGIRHLDPDTLVLYEVRTSETIYMLHAFIFQQFC